MLTASLHNHQNANSLRKYKAALCFLKDFVFCPRNIFIFGANRIRGGLITSGCGYNIAIQSDAPVFIMIYHCIHHSIKIMVMMMMVVIMMLMIMMITMKKKADRACETIMFSRSR